MKRRTFIVIIGATAVLTACGKQDGASSSQSSVQKNEEKGDTKAASMMDKLALFAQQLGSNTPDRPLLSKNVIAISAIFDRGELSQMAEEKSENGIRGIVLANSKPNSGFYPQAHYLNSTLQAVSVFDSFAGVVYYLPLESYTDKLFFVARGFNLAGEKIGDKANPIQLVNGANVISSFTAIRAKFYYGTLKEVQAAPLD